MGAIPGQSTDASNRFASRLLGFTLRVSRRVALLLLAVALAVCWAAVNAFGGASTVPPHLYYVPIVFAGIRFGWVGAVGTALVATVLAGPLTPADVSTGSPQHLSDWLTRGGFFVVIGVMLTVLVAAAVSAREAELAVAEEARSVRAALATGRVVVHYQPVVAIPGGTRLLGAEALVRIRDHDGSTIPPDQFIPAAEMNGTIRPLGAYVLRTACAQLAEWRREGLVDDGFLMAVNASPRQLEDPTFVDTVSTILAASGIEGGSLVIETTETALADDRSAFIESLHALRDMGVKLSMDDFGTGNSTLAELQELPMDAIKIDRAFVRDIDADGGPLARHVVDLAEAMHLTTVAEGVETDAQEATLVSLGCQTGQGYLYSPPLPPTRFRSYAVELRARAGAATPPVDEAPT